MNSRRSSWLGIGLAALAFVATCKHREAGHDHASDHPPGHDHHDEAHGHGDEPVVRITRWSERLELFAEHAAAVVGKPVSVLAHLTVLDGFRPLDTGTVRLEFEGPASVDAEVQAAERPGIFRLTFVPAKPGSYRGKLVVSRSITDVVEGLALEVFANDQLARAAAPKEEPDRFIELLKEQQWGVPFATEFARKATLVPSIEVAGTVDTPPGGSAEVGAPIAGRIVPPTRGLPRPGDAVAKGQVLATLAPAPSSPEEAARAKLAVSESEARLARASAAVQRSERLIRDQAISQRELEDAQREARVAEQALRTAKTAQQAYAGATAGSGAGSWRLVSPIDGTLVDVRATPGAAVSQGTGLFRVVDTRELWIRARVPEQDAAHLRVDRDASYQIAGLEGFLPIDVTGNDAAASLVTVGRTVDPTSRTVDVIYSLSTGPRKLVAAPVAEPRRTRGGRRSATGGSATTDNDAIGDGSAARVVTNLRGPVLSSPDPRLRVGGLVRVSIPAGEDFTGVVIANSAIIDNDGRQVVYVQIDGEHFEERLVRTGPRQGGSTGVVHGLTGGERIVERGANIVRLSAQAGSSQPHGHIH